MKDKEYTPVIYFVIWKEWPAIAPISDAPFDGTRSKHIYQWSDPDVVAVFPPADRMPGVRSAGV